MRAARQAAFVLGAVALALACVPPPRLVVVSGNDQIGASGVPLPAPLVVAIVDAKGAPVANASVTFQVTGGAGTLSPSVANTDAAGHAATTLTPTSGNVTVTASSPAALGSVPLHAFVAGTASHFTLLDDFEGATSPVPWTFSADRGARGSLSAGSGFTGKGAHLAYDFTQGGSFAGATLALPNPTSAAAVAFRVKAPAGIHVQLSVVDAAGQTHLYAPPRPLEAIDPNAWFREAILVDGGTIASITIMAAGPLLAGTSGAIDLDDVGLVDANALDLDPRAATLLPPPAGVTALDQDLGVAIHFTQDDKALDAAKAAGFDFVRMDLAWDWIEKTAGVYDFSAFDALLASLDARGLKALFILDYGNPLYQSGPGWAPETPAQVAAFGNYVEAAARHFAGRAVRYEIWNEPNLPQYWKPLPDTGAYAPLASEAVKRVHAGDPAAAISLGGTSGFAFGFIEDVIARGALQGAQAVAVHPYRSANPETVSDELLLLRSIAGTAQTWETEWGYTTDDLGSDVRHGLWVVRELLSMRALGSPLSVYYEIRDDPSGRFGLLDASYNAKSAFKAMATFKAQCQGRTFAGFLPTQPTGLHALRLDGASDVVCVLWHDTAGAATPVSFPAGATAADAFGNAVTPATTAGKAVFVVSEDAGPLYVRVP